MKIVVNKDAQKRKHQELIDQIVNSAQEHASNGISTFGINIMQPAGYGINIHQLLKDVYEVTEGTVVYSSNVMWRFYFNIVEPEKQTK